MSPNHHSHHTQAFTDPVCGMSVRPQSAAGSVERDGATYWFCSPGCASKFKADPGSYTHEPRDPAPEAHGRPGVTYTCPMHPEVVRSEPGSCPICGMALEPRTVTTEEPDNPELRDMTRRFWVSSLLTAPLFLISMGAMLAGHPAGSWIAPRHLALVELALATPVVLWGGWPFFARMWASFRSGKLNMFTLVGIGTGTAYGYSVVAALAPGILCGA